VTERAIEAVSCDRRQGSTALHYSAGWGSLKTTALLMEVRESKPQAVQQPILSILCLEGDYAV
jgi:hypothetical protein